MFDICEMTRFVEESKLFSDSSEFSFESMTGNTISFVHFTGVRFVVLCGEGTRLAQLFYGSVASPAVLWFWNELENGWKLESYDFLGGSVRLRTLSDFIHFFELGRKGA